MTDRAPQGKLATLHWSALTEMARQQRENEAQDTCDKFNNDMSHPHTMDWRWGWRGIQFVGTVRGKSKQ